MNIDTSGTKIAQIFSDTAEIFIDSVTPDGLRLLLSYCFEITALQRGRIVFDDSYLGPKLEVTHDGSAEERSFFSQSLAERAALSLRPELMSVKVAEKPHKEYVFPLRIHGMSLGVIHLVGSADSTLNAHSLAVMQGVADIAAIAITQSHRIQQAQMLASQLQGALESRVMIEQAKGIIAEREKVDFVDAFHHIRSQARREQRPVTSVAADIVSDHRCSMLNVNPLHATQRGR